MKKIFITVIFVALFAMDVYSQSIVDVIYLKNGDILKGEVIKDMPNDYLQIEMKDGSIRKIAYKELEKRERFAPTPTVETEQSDYCKSGSIGIGLGIPFGTIGINSEYNVNDYLSSSVGLGYAVYGIGYSLGARVYTNPIKDKFRWMFELDYGTNGVFADEEASYTGITVGTGFKWMWGETRRFGIEMQLMYILQSDMYDVIDEYQSMGYSVEDNGRVKLSIGFRVGL